jgi:UDP-N-acetylglucosamine--N-acetylmuramyl-(pentapeptide) pyrophosphoryl-undecaprenol N-acetylglucosamine transferase
MLNLCDRLTVGHLKVKGIKKKYNNKIFYTGNPIRSEIFKYKKDYKTHHQDGFLNLLIFGGSQGASFFSDIIPDSINKLDNKKKSLLRVFHQVRNNEFERVKKCYHSMNVKSEVKTFFYNLPELLNNSHLLISRSGASTVAEVAATKTPAIFIPFHHSIDDDQRLNTIELEKIGQVIVKNEKKLDSNQLYKVIDELIEKPEILEKMSKANKEIVVNNSSEKIRSIIDDLLSNREL